MVRDIISCLIKVARLLFFSMDASDHTGRPFQQTSDIACSHRESLGRYTICLPLFYHSRRGNWSCRYHAVTNGLEAGSASTEKEGIDVLSLILYRADIYAFRSTKAHLRLGRRPALQLPTMPEEALTESDDGNRYGSDRDSRFWPCCKSSRHLEKESSAEVGEDLLQLTLKFCLVARTMIAGWSASGFTLLASLKSPPSFEKRVIDTSW